MDPQTPPPDEPRPSVNDLGLTTPGAASSVSSDDDLSQLTQASEVAAPDSQETLDLSQLDPPVTSDGPEELDEPLVKPAPPVQPRSMPAFMQGSNQSTNTSKTTNTTDTTHHTTHTVMSAPSDNPQSQAFNPSPNQTVIVKKSHTLLIVIIVLVLLLAGGAAAFFLLKNKKDNTATTPATSDTAQTDTQSNTTTPAGESTGSADAVAAQTLSDLKTVCSGKTPISNAADYSSNKAAVITGFYNSPATPDNWKSLVPATTEKSYYPGTDYQKVSVVACLTYIDGSPQTSIDCEYNDSDNKPVTVKYTSTKYSLAFYEAKTGKLISEGEDITGPATTCPSFISYNKDTKVAYAQPDTKAIEAAFDTFVK